MKHKLVKSLVLSIVLIFTFSTLIFASGSGVEKKVDGINVGLSFKADKVKTGNNDVVITLHDSKDQPVENAKVSVTAEMDKNMDMKMDMNNSKPMAVDLKPGTEKGQYVGTVNLTDKGKWNITTNFTVQGQAKNAVFDVDVMGGGPNWAIIGGFLGVIALIIVIAAINKKKALKA